MRTTADIAIGLAIWVFAYGAMRAFGEGNTFAVIYATFNLGVYATSYWLSYRRSRMLP